MWFRDRTTVNVRRLEGYVLLYAFVFYSYLMHFVFDSMYKINGSSQQPQYSAHILPERSSHLLLALLLCSFIPSAKRICYLLVLVLAIFCLVCLICLCAVRRIWYILWHNVWNGFYRWNSNILIQIDARYMSRTNFLRVYFLHIQYNNNTHN